MKRVAAVFIATVSLLACETLDDTFMCGRACGTAGMKSFRKDGGEGCKPITPVCECNPAPAIRADGGAP